MMKKNKIEQIIEIDINKIKLNKEQPRKEFDKEKIKELARSIKENGLINPIQVKKINNNKYGLVCGERRFRAYKYLKLKKIKAIVKNYNSNKEEMIESLIENLQRVDLNSVEKENFVTQLWNTGKYKSYVELGKELGFTDGSYISSLLDTKKLRDKAKIPKNISTRIVNKLRCVKNIDDVKEVIKKIENKEINKFKIEEYAKAINTPYTDVKKSLLKNKISLEQASKLNKISNERLRNEIIKAHSDIKKIDNRIDETSQKEINNNKIKIVNVNELINNFRYNTLETQKLIQNSLNSFKKCVEHINLIDDKQLNKLNHFEELFEINLETTLNLLETLKEHTLP
jgi:ParB family transcriptional regulator, chromosome partitioning protein